MKKTILALLICASAVTSTGASTCIAQPANEPGKAQNPVPADVQKEALDKAMAEGRKQAEAAMAMTPAQRREWLEGIMTQQLRALMTASGLNDLELQDRIGLFLSDQSTARGKLRESAARLRDAIADKKSTPEQIAAISTAYQAATEVERARKAQADSDLATELELAKYPRLEGFLRLYGIIGDGSWFTGGIISGMGSLAMLPDAAELAALKAQ